MTLRECYRLLDLPPGAPPDAVKRAYRNMARRWHPDRYPEDPARQKAAEARFKAINAAYARLCAASAQERDAVKQHRVPAPVRYTKAANTAPADRSTIAHRSGRGIARYRRSQQIAASGSRRRAASVSQGRPPAASGRARSSVHASGEKSAESRRGLEGWKGVIAVAGAVGVFCLGVMRSASLAELFAWTAIWAVIAAGAFALVPRRKPS